MLLMCFLITYNHTCTRPCLDVVVTRSPINTTNTLIRLHRTSGPPITLLLFPDERNGWMFNFIFLPEELQFIFMALNYDCRWNFALTCRAKGLYMHIFSSHQMSTSFRKVLALEHLLFFMMLEWHKRILVYSFFFFFFLPSVDPVSTWQA